MESESRTPAGRREPAAIWFYSLICHRSHTVVSTAGGGWPQASESTIVRPDRAAQLGVGGKLNGHGDARDRRAGRRRRWPCLSRRSVAWIDIPARMIGLRTSNPAEAGCLGGVARMTGTSFDQNPTAPVIMKPLNCPPCRMSVTGKSLYFWFTYSSLPSTLGVRNHPPPTSYRSTD